MLINVACSVNTHALRKKVKSETSWDPPLSLNIPVSFNKICRQRYQQSSFPQDKEGLLCITARAQVTTGQTPRTFKPGPLS